MTVQTYLAELTTRGRITGPPALVDAAWGRLVERAELDPRVILPRGYRYVTADTPPGEITLTLEVP